jgi:hypothetical protein
MNRRKQAYVFFPNMDGSEQENWHYSSIQGDSAVSAEWGLETHHKGLAEQS